MSKNYYHILGVPENAGDSDIKQAYRALAKRWHPDKNPGNFAAEEKFKEILEAYLTLSDPMLRRQYDMKLLRHDLYNDNVTFTAPDTQEDKRDRRKTYSEDFMNRVRNKTQERSQAHIKRRKYIFGGMLITFIVFMVWASIFQYNIDKERELQAQILEMRIRNAKVAEKQTTPLVIQDLDSPFDGWFGTPVYTRFSPNELVIISPFSDAVVCVTEADAPYRTIRNEFIHARRSFNIRELPNGRFRVKIYTGENWNLKKSMVLNFRLGKAYGGFEKDEELYLIDLPPFALKKPTYDEPNTNTSDTIILDPTRVQMREMSTTEFFANGN
ncbi:MAG: J domain-containing protein [Bacteroidia bacterium]